LVFKPFTNRLQTVYNVAKWDKKVNREFFDRNKIETFLFIGYYYKIGGL